MVIPTPTAEPFSAVIIGLCRECSARANRPPLRHVSSWGLKPSFPDVKFCVNGRNRFEDYTTHPSLCSRALSSRYPNPLSKSAPAQKIFP